LKSLNKVKPNKYDVDDSDAEGSSGVGMTEARKRPKKNKKKEEEQRLIDFFNQMDDTDGKILPYVNDWKWFGLIIQCI
jgi:hypothetical protein